MATSGKRPFWMHQIVEYILGGVLVASGLQSSTPAVPSVLGGIVMLNSAMTAGPAGAFRVFKRRLHQVLDVAVIAAELLAALQPWISLASPTRVIIVAIAVVHVFVWSQTNFSERVKSLAVSQEGGRSTEVGRIAGRLVGNGVNAVRRQRGGGR
jgi:hypothetical protein